MLVVLVKYNNVWYELFPKLKNDLEKFSDINNLNEEVSRRVRELNKDSILCGIQELSTRWISCTGKQGDYIEEL